jgi:hypothetical protein
VIRSGLTFAGHHLEIGYDDGQAEALMRFAWSRHLAPSRPEMTPAFTLHDIGADRVRFVQPGVLDLELTPPDALNVIIDRPTQWFAGAMHDGLLLHAAALMKGNRAIVCPGTSGAGKSTLAFWLGTAGYTCLTDELALIDPRSSTVSGLQRPLSFKPSGVRVLERSDALGALRIVRAAAGVFVETPQTTTHDRADTVPIATLIFPRYVVGAPLQIRELSAGDAAIRVMETLINAPSLRRHGLSDAGGLACTVPAFELSGDNLQESAGLIARLFD